MALNNCLSWTREYALLTLPGGYLYGAQNTFDAALLGELCTMKYLIRNHHVQRDTTHRLSQGCYDTTDVGDLAIIRLEGENHRRSVNIDARHATKMIRHGNSCARLDI